MDNLKFFFYKGGIIDCVYQINDNNRKVLFNTLVHNEQTCQTW